ncbi:MAG: methyltransferase domain-containing protein [Nostochopsis sp.]
MNEKDESQVNVDEIMHKIREEVVKRRNYSQLKRATNQSTLPSIQKHYNATIELIQSLLKNAQLRSETRTKWPDNLNKFPFNLSKNIQKNFLKVLNFIFKDQREVNYNIIRALQESVALNRQLIEQVASLRLQIDRRLVDMETQSQNMDKRFGTVYSGVPEIDENLRNFEKQLNAVNNQEKELEEHLKATDTRLQLMDDRLNRVDTHLQDINEQLSNVNSHMQTTDERLQRMDNRHLRNDNYIKNDLIQQKRLLMMFLEEAKRRLPEPFDQQQLQTFVNQEQHLLDSFYTAFEDRFRGSCEEIKNRLTTYIPYIEKAIAATENAAILDIGCGRGEWLELLSERGMKSSGVDINTTMVQCCQEKGLNAAKEDGLLYLRNIEANSLAGLTAFHVIEHLSLQDFISLIDEALRVIRPGGIVIFETPNPENLIVGACNFYIDPTHRNPIPPPTAQFLLENRGFSHVQIHRLHPMTDEHGLDNQLLKDILLGCQDYAVIGWKS